MNSPATRPSTTSASAAAATITKVPLFAFRSAATLCHAGESFRAVSYSTAASPPPGWEFVGPVGSLFGIGSAPPHSRPLVQVRRPLGSDQTFELLLAPADVGTSAYTTWRNGLLTGGATAVDVLGEAVPPNIDPLGTQFTSPLLEVTFTAPDGTQITDVVTTNLDVYADVANGDPNPFGTSGTGSAKGAIAQIVPTFEVEVDHIGGAPIAMVTVGIPGPNAGDIEVPVGPGTLIDFYPRGGSAIAVESVAVTQGGTPANGFTPIQVDGDRVLIEDAGAVGLFDYTLSIKRATGERDRLDPRIRNRSTIG